MPKKNLLTEDRAGMKVDVWYADLKNCIFGDTTDIRQISDRTFLKIFFAPAFYNRYLGEYKKQTEKDFDPSVFDSDFYCWDSQSMRYSDLFDFQQSIGGLELKDTIAPLRKKVLDMMNHIADSILKEGRNQCSLFDDYRQLTAANNPEKYEADFIFGEFYHHREFYTEYLKILLKFLEFKNEIIDTDRMLCRIHSLLISKNGFGLNIPCRDEKNIDDTYYNIASYLYVYILICTGSGCSVEVSLSRFNIGARSAVNRDLSNYAGVIEHYSVNSVERFAALRELAEQGNLYAMQDLYFICSNDNILYSNDGSRRYFLKRNYSEAKDYYEKIKASSESRCFHNVHFRHDGNYQSEEFTPALVRKYQSEYRNYTVEQTREMMKNLAKRCDSRIYPLSLDLMFFMEEVFEENEFLKEPQELGYDYWRIADYFHRNPWTERFRLPDANPFPDQLKIGISDFCEFTAHTSSLSLLDIMFSIIKYVRETNDNELEAVCSTLAGSDIGILKETLVSAGGKYSECTAKLFYMDDGAEKDELDENQRIWKKVGDIIRRVIGQIKNNCQ